MKVCHMTSAHGQEDIRIFIKECTSLCEKGYEVYQVSCGTDYEKNGVHMMGVGSAESNRVRRMVKTAREVYLKAVTVDADVYHFHDPELLPYGLKLKKRGKVVVFDSHEDVPAQIMDKKWIMRPLRKTISKMYKLYETYTVKKLDAVVAATSHIAKAFSNRCKRIVVVNNYPKLDDIEFHTQSFTERDGIICYAGGIDDLRGENIMIEAMKGSEGKLIIAGDHEVLYVGDNIRYVGRLDRSGVNNLYGTAIAGLCILKPIENYYYSKPIKVYEYMAAGLPYICSDFPEWRKVAEESGAGICVNPDNIQEIKEAIKMLLINREKGQIMGEKGRKYVLEKCNWNNEEKKLLSLYKDLEKECLSVRY